MYIYKQYKNKEVRQLQSDLVGYIEKRTLERPDEIRRLEREIERLRDCLCREQVQRQAICDYLGVDINWQPSYWYVEEREE